jgi:diadenosine tetraphosphate (Ap4A) HIT family hydrolase
MNATLQKFGFPATLVQEFEHWVVLLRPAQVTLGSLVLAAKCDVTAFGDLPADAFAELKQATAAIEDALSRFVAFDKINYLMLMMVDPHVHFHVIPRYDGVRAWRGCEFPDHGWPKTPELTNAVTLEPATRDDLVEDLRARFSAGPKPIRPVT